VFEVVVLLIPLEAVVLVVVGMELIAAHRAVEFMMLLLDKDMMVEMVMVLVPSNREEEEEEELRKVLRTLVMMEVLAVLDTLMILVRLVVVTVEFMPVVEVGLQIAQVLQEVLAAQVEVVVEQLLIALLLLTPLRQAVMLIPEAEAEEEELPVVESVVQGW
jgi:hypothetical protein